MKLAEFIAKLEKADKALNSSSEKITSGNGFMLESEELKSLEDKLFQCEEFKNVVRINYITLPRYLVDEESGEPIANNREFLGGQTRTDEVSTFQINPDQKINFNKIVDIYSIRLIKKYSSKEEIIKPGIWVYPTDYNETTFLPTNQIRVIWNPEQLKDTLKLVGTLETPKERLMRMFESTLDNMEPNIPCEYVLTIRCSSRSVIANSLPSPEKTEIPMIIPPVVVTPVEINTDIVSNTDESVISK